MSLMKSILTSNLLRNTNPLRCAINQRFYAASFKVALDSDIKFEELQQKVKNNEVTIIDTRNPSEANENGIIKNAILIPVNPLGHIALSDPKEFKEQFGVEKPSKDAPIVTMCKLGVRARTAQLVLQAAGYTNVRVYVGSFDEWSAKGGEYVMPDPKIEYETTFEGQTFKY